MSVLELVVVGMGAVFLIGCGVLIAIARRL